MFNTFGIHSINRDTFNMRDHDQLMFPRTVRNVIVTALRINNAVLNVLGYIQGTSLRSGSARILIGASLIVVTLAIGDRKATSGTIIRRWYDEAILTGIAQIARGTLEAVVPFGWIATSALDIIATPLNLRKNDLRSCTNCNRVHPHDHPVYPFPLSLLYLA